MTVDEVFGRVGFGTKNNHLDLEINLDSVIFILIYLFVICEIALLCYYLPLICLLHMTLYKYVFVFFCFQGK